MANRILKLRHALHTGVALTAFALTPGSLSAETTDAASATVAPAEQTPAGDGTAVATAPVEERQSYAVRTMAQIYDGTRDLSHTQMLGIGRARKGNRSVTQFDFGDGAVVITPNAGDLSASRFLNITGSERRVVYDYDDRTVLGDSEVAEFHNRIVRPWLGRGPDLGRDASWTQSIPLNALGMGQLGDGDFRIELSRTYFMHQGKSMVLVQYAIPAFSYDAGSGKTVVQWGRGLALTDPGFGMIYLNAALHRAVETAPGMPARPYRYARAMIAANPDGSAMIDYREVKQLEGLIEPIMGPDAMRVVPVSEPDETPNNRPLSLGRTLDLLALSIGEDGANEVPIGASVQTGDDRGTEASSELVERIRTQLGQELGVEPSLVSDELVSATLRTLGARAMTMGEGFFTRPEDSDVVAEELTGSLQSPGAGASGQSSTGMSAEERAVEQAANAIIQQYGGANSDPFGTTPETIEAINNSRAQGGDPVGDAFKRVSGGGDSSALFGGGGDEEPSTGEKVEDAANKVNQANQVAGAGKAGTGTRVIDSGGQAVNATNAQLRPVLENLASEGNAIISKLEGFNTQIENLETKLASLEVTPEFSPNVVQASNVLDAETTILNGLDDQLNALASQINKIKAAGDDIPQNILSQFDQVIASRAAQAQKTDAALKAFQDAATAPGAMKFVAGDGAESARLLAELNDAKREASALESSLAVLGGKYQQLAELIKSTPVSRLNDLLTSLGDSKAGKLLDGLGHALNLWSIGKSGANIYTASTTNIGSGQALPLTRDYSGSKGAMVGFGAEMLGLLGNAATLNLPGFVSDATAITLGSVSDIVIAYKGVVDVEEYKLQAAREAVRLETMKTERAIKREAEILAELKDTPYGLYTDEPTTDGGVSDPNWTDPRIDPETGLPKPGYWAYLKENYPGTLRTYGIDPEAPVGHTGPWPPAPQTPKQTRKPTLGDGPGYPTAPERDPDLAKNDSDGDYDGPPPSELPPEILAEIEREKRRAEAQEKLDAYQEEKLAQMKEDEANNPALNGGSDVTLSTLEVSELVVSTFDIKPVRFDMPTFDMPVFDEEGDLFVRNPDGTTSLRKVGPDDFELTPFDPPDISRFPPTDPDDIDGYPGTGEYPAYGFDNLSGTVETDLSRWEEWLATQDVRKLTQLALAAGYPNLASALADAENIIRLSQDSGYRQWANTAPSCSGYVGCGPSYLGRWAMKRSIVALGDILAQSRGIFSTGGFTDIGISGFNLMYILRDFGIQDGDLIDVEISQFGRVIGRVEGHFLLTAGSPFNVRLRQGVAQMVITALNEGSASPNTAEVTIENVVRGDAVQTYSLETGQTATLRIEAGATASGSSNTGNNTASGQQGTTARPTQTTPVQRIRPSALPTSRRRGPAGEPLIIQ